MLWGLVWQRIPITIRPVFQGTVLPTAGWDTTNLDDGQVYILWKSDMITWLEPLDTNDSEGQCGNQAGPSSTPTLRVLLAFIKARVTEM